MSAYSSWWRGRIANALGRNNRREGSNPSADAIWWDNKVGLCGRLKIFKSWFDPKSHHHAEMAESGRMHLTWNQEYGISVPWVQILLSAPYYAGLGKWLSHRTFYAASGVRIPYPVPFLIIIKFIIEAAGTLIPRKSSLRKL